MNNSNRPNFALSNRKNKKYMVISPKGKVIYFGGIKQDGTPYEQYEDKLGKYSKYDHNDKQRRDRYLKRAKGIKDKQGKLTWKNKESANYYSIKYLW